MNSNFALDRTNGKLMGVCSGFARWAEIDLGAARVTAVLAALLFPPVIVGYVVAGMVAEAR
jgi:phage shock protein PspC (stress-responsive transcriptional regulator)